MTRRAIFSQTGLSRRGKDAWLPYGSININCFSHEHNDPLPRLGIEPRVDNLAIANSCSYPLTT